eukprot:SAG31_NODE_37801_length_301_cov_1.014851_1_plen_30_part_10
MQDSDNDDNDEQTVHFSIMHDLTLGVEVKI